MGLLRPETGVLVRLSMCRTMHSLVVRAVLSHCCVPRQLQQAEASGFVMGFGHQDCSGRDCLAFRRSRAPTAFHLGLRLTPPSYMHLNIPWFPTDP